MWIVYFILVLSFFFNDTATTEIYTLSLHDALPISNGNGHQDAGEKGLPGVRLVTTRGLAAITDELDRKSTRLNSSHEWISYAVFCLKKKNRLGRSASTSALLSHRVLSVRMEHTCNT